MKINKLAIQNFRNLKNTAIDLDRLNIFVGPNNSGKSSILAAIEWALTGRNLWTDKAGRGANDLITKGEKICQVAIDLDDFGGIVREIPPHSLTAGRFQGVQEGQAAICNFLEADEKLIQLLMNAGAFMNMPPAEQKAFLFGLCGISFSQEKIKQAVFKLTGDEEITKRAIQLMPGKLDGDPAILQGMEKRAREMRKETKKELERTKAALAEMELPNLPDGIGLENKEEVTQQLKELGHEKDKLLKAIGETRATEKNKTYIQNKYASSTNETKRLTEEKKKKSAELAGANKTEIAAKLEELKKQREQLNEMLDNFDRVSLKLENELAVKLPIIETLNRFDGKCPLAPELINCRMTSNEINDLTTKLKAECELANKNMKQITDEKAKLNKHGDKNYNEITQLENVLAGLTKVENEISFLDMAIERARKEMAGAEEELARIEETKAGETNPEAVDYLDERIDRGREILRQLDLAEHGRRQAGLLQADLKAIQKEVEFLEALVKVLGPDGIRKALFGDQLKDFTELLNNQLSLITEGRYQLTWDDDFTPLVRQNGSLLPLKLLSKSEQLRVGIAFQTTIAKQAGLRFLAVDEVDMLDQDNRDLLTGTMISQMDEFDQTIMLCTVGDVTPKNPEIPGLKMFLVENGNVKEL
jgi:exonuclease SbcC